MFPGCCFGVGVGKAHLYLSSLCSPTLLALWEQNDGFFFFFLLFRAGAVPAEVPRLGVELELQLTTGLRHRHSNTARSELRLQPIPQLTAMPDR